MLEKAASIKRFEYSPLGSELKKETDIVGKHRGLNKVYRSDKKEDDETINIEGKDDGKHQQLKSIRAMLHLGHAYQKSMTHS